MGEGVGGEGVVVVEQRDVGAGGHVQGGVGGGGDTAGVLASCEVDAGVLGGVALEGGDDVGVGGAVVDQAEFPVLEGLLAYGSDGFLEHGNGRVVDRGEDGDERAVGGQSVRVGGMLGCARGDWWGGGIDEGGLEPDPAGDRPVLMGAGVQREVQGGAPGR
ncbi:MAG TPA: hypothetical protein VKQ71_01975 [Acidimicrobiales bacterium]|nr:hypothetical protein [Acidimicrobiales bacterium]